MTSHGGNFATWKDEIGKLTYDVIIVDARTFKRPLQEVRDLEVDWLVLNLQLDSEGLSDVTSWIREIDPEFRPKPLVPDVDVLAGC